MMLTIFRKAVFEKEGKPMRAAFDAGTYANFCHCMLAPGGEDAKLIHLLPTADERGKIHALPADPPGDVPRSVMV